MPFSHTLTPKKPGQPQLPSNHPVTAPLQGAEPQVQREGFAATRARASSAETSVLLAHEEAPERLPEPPGGAEDNEVRPGGRVPPPPHLHSLPTRWSRLWAAFQDCRSSGTSPTVEVRFPFKAWSESAPHHQESLPEGAGRWAGLE